MAEGARQRQLGSGMLLAVILVEAVEMAELLVRWMVILPLVGGEAVYIFGTLRAMLNMN